jgi:putative membrane protein
MSLHESLKTVHIVAMALWIGSMVALALILPRLRGRPGTGELLAAVTALTTGAMIATLALGITLAAYAGWFSERWVHAKLALAFVLAGFHGVITGQLRRLSSEGAHQPPHWIAIVPYVIVGLALVTVAVAVAKP